MRGCAVQQARDDDGVLQSLDAGAVGPASRRSTIRNGKSRRAAAVNLLSEFCSFGDGASAGSSGKPTAWTKFVELLGEDPDDHTETAANDLFTATARVVEGLATDDGDRRCIGRGGRAAAR